MKEINKYRRIAKKQGVTLNAIYNRKYEGWTEREIRRGYRYYRIPKKPTPPPALCETIRDHNVALAAVFYDVCCCLNKGSGALSNAIMAVDLMHTFKERGGDDTDDR